MKQPPLVNSRTHRDVIDREIDLPSISSLRAFIAAAKSKSFSDAAEELGFTQSGVSRAVKSLEELSGVQLFERTGHGLVLTERGRIFLDDAISIIDDLGAATLRLSSYSNTGQKLTIACLPTLGSRWLAPRVVGFLAKNPDVELSVVATIEQFSFAGSGIDAAIHFDTAAWRDCSAIKLFDEISLPYCSPDLLAKSKVSPTKFLQSAVLIQHLYRPTAWRDWFRIAGINRSNPITGPCFEQFQMGIQAAVSGAGALLMHPWFVADELRDGRLVPLSDIHWQSTVGYYFIFPRSNGINPALRRFRDWLRSEARVSREVVENTRTER